MEKTNVIRILEQKKIKYHAYEYPHTDSCVDGENVAKLLGQNPLQVFKTLVTISKSKQYFVFVIPVEFELDLKKAASSVGEKSIEMIHVKDLLAITGYIRGGCSPIGMKKSFKTIVDISATNFQTIIFSAGKIGFQVEMNPNDLATLINSRFIDIVKEKQN